MSVLRHVIRKEVLQLRRDRKMIPMLLGAPLIQLVVFGYAANLDVTRVPLLVADEDRTAGSRALSQRFTGSGYFDLKGAATEADGIGRAFVSGDAQVALVIPSGYAADLAAGRAAAVQIIADGTDANSALLGLSYASRIVAGMSGELAAASPTAGRAAGMSSAARPDATAPGAAAAVSFSEPPSIEAVRAPSVGRIDLVPRVWYNPDLRSRWFYIPAILAMVLMLTTMVLPSMAVVREKEIGTLEQIIVTPIRSWELILGKLLPFGVIGLLTTGLVALLAVTLFRVPLRGSFPLLMALSALFLLTTLGLGLLVSTVVRNQQQAMMAAIFLLMVPMIYLSGLLFPIENMPGVIQGVTLAIPLRYYNVILRGIFLKGAGLETLWREAAVLLIYGIGILALASARFRKRLD